MAEKEQYPVFRKYSRQWLCKKTGYSEGYLSRIATGKMPLNRSFIERMCFNLHKTKKELFSKEVSDGS